MKTKLTKSLSMAIKVKGSVFNLDDESESFFNSLETKEFLNCEEEFVSQRFKSLREVFEKTRETIIQKKAYILSDDNYRLDVKIGIDRPSNTNLKSVFNDEGIIRSTFYIPIDLEDIGEEDCKLFLDWYSRHYQALLVHIIKNRLGHKVLQPDKDYYTYKVVNGVLIFKPNFKVVF